MGLQQEKHPLKLSACIPYSSSTNLAAVEDDGGVLSSCSEHQLRFTVKLAVRMYKKQKVWIKTGGADWA